MGFLTNLKGLRRERAEEDVKGILRGSEGSPKGILKGIQPESDKNPEGKPERSPKGFPEDSLGGLRRV